MKLGFKALPSNIKALLAAHDDSSRIDQWSILGLRTPKSNISTLKMKLAEDDNLDVNYADDIILFNC